jgi:glycerate kinase
MTIEGMRILIAPDKFKGALSAREVADSIAAGLRDVLPDAKIDIAPMADGGEGTAEVISQALGAAWVKCKAHDPLGREIEARYGWIENHPPSPTLRRDSGKLAVMEMSEAAGMRRLRPNEYDVDLASTFGVGEMILDAAKRGAQQIIIGLGGSATNDGGFGMARALGFQFEHEQEQEHERKHVSDLITLRRIEKPTDLKLPGIVAAVDVRNPLLGENGATRVFGPQKGATPDQIKILERALAKLADVIAEQFGFDHRDKPGAGAAGVARLARTLGKRVFAMVGRATEDRQARELFDGVYQNARAGMSQEENMKKAADLLRENARELAKSL